MRCRSSARAASSPGRAGPWRRRSRRSASTSGRWSRSATSSTLCALARNILKYAGKGQIALRRLPGEREGIEVIASDQGPGIADVELVLSPRYRSKTGMGVGLRGSRRLVDHFEVDSRAGSGTTVVLRKYRF